MLIDTRFKYFKIIIDTLLTLQYNYSWQDSYQVYYKGAACYKKILYIK